MSQFRPHRTSDAELLFALVFFTAISVSYLLRSSTWRGAPSVFSLRKLLEPLWPFPDSWLRGTTRAFYPILACFVFMAMFLACTWCGRMGVAGAWVGSVGHSLGWATLSSLGLALSIALLNRPKILVPRLFREEPGMIRELCEIVADAVNWISRR